MNRLQSNREWEMWGEKDPLWGVAAYKDRKRTGSNPWNNDDFYKMGSQDWKDFSEVWSTFGMQKGSCLEIGCGAGRITRHIENDFDSVHAIDVSPGMLEYARENAGTKKTTFHLYDGVNIPLPDNSVEAAFSCHVFQHLDSLEDAHDLFLEVYRVLAPGGTLLIHIPVHFWPFRSKKYKALHKLGLKLGNMRKKWRRTLGNLGLTDPYMAGLSFPEEFFFSKLSRSGFEGGMLTTFALKSNNVPHTCYLVKKHKDDVQAPK